MRGLLPVDDWVLFGDIDFSQKKISRPQTIEK
jgi:hypothetical protein